ncbi:MAG: HAD family hydrolase [Nanoarchaeota archaeon]|nr:HAD family hydrolase [Nanoarchaeota archaeon]
MKLILFDLDNTLVKSDMSHGIAFNKSLSKLGFKKINVKKMSKHFGKPKDGVVEALAPTKDKKILNKILYYHDMYLYEVSKKYNRKVRGVVGVLKFLKKKYKLGIVSNCKHKNILTLLKASGLDYKLFDVIVGNDDVRRSKPFPDEIFKAEKILHMDACCIVGDSVYDVRAGKKAKVKTISVLTGVYSRNVLKKEKPDYILKSVVDLKKIEI